MTSSVGGGSAGRSTVVVVLLLLRLLAIRKRFEKASAGNRCEFEEHFAFLIETDSQCLDICQNGYHAVESAFNVLGNSFASFCSAEEERVLHLKDCSMMLIYSLTKAPSLSSLDVCLNEHACFLFFVLPPLTLTHIHVQILPLSLSLSIYLASMFVSNLVTLAPN